MLVIELLLLSFQYYEMSYGLNIEMHKQVCTIMLLIFSRLVGMSEPGAAAYRLWTELSVGNRLYTHTSTVHKQGIAIANSYYAHT